MMLVTRSAVPFTNHQYASMQYAYLCSATLELTEVPAGAPGSKNPQLALFGAAAMIALAESMVVFKS